VVALFAAGIVLLAVVSYESYRSTAEVARNARWTAHSFEVLASIQLARAELAEAQSAQRGFLLTEEDSLRVVADTLEGHLEGTVQTLRALTADNASQQARLDSVVPLVRERVARLNDVMRLRQERGIAAAAAAVREGSGARLSGEIQRRLDNIARAEFRLVEVRDSTLGARAAHAEAVDILGGVVSTVFLGIALLMLLDDLRKRERMEAELRVARDAAQEASRAKSDFLATMSHEIRTPMNGVIGMTELLLDTDPTPTQREYLNTVRTSAYSLLGIINDILDFSKIEAGRFELDAVPFALRDSLAVTVRTLATRAADKGLELTCGIAADVPDNLIGDLGRLRQILLNLVGNAIKFTEDGEVSVQVRSESVGPDRVTLRFTVTDTGIGIPADKQAAIFEAFTQADRSTTRQYGGTGLGLTIASQLVTMFGGVIGVDSTVAVGSTFHFTARFDRSDAAPERTSQAAVVPVAGKRVLVVDDSATNRRILSEILSAWQMEVAIADGGETALSQLRDARSSGRSFALVIVDAIMPGMDGFELAKTILEEEQTSLPTVMMLSSSGAAGQAARARDLKIQSVLTKPVTQSDLLEAVQRALAATGQHPVASPPAVAPLVRERTPLRILLAEDNRVNRQVAIGLLEKRGHHVHVAENGRRAVERSAAEVFDLILMDVQMPEMDGVEATRRIREREQQHGRARLPIVALTAHAMTGDAERFIAVGMDEYLSKPLRPELLYGTLIRLFPSTGIPEVPVRVLEEDDALERVGGSRKLLKQIATIFLEDMPRMLGDIRQAVRDSDALALTSSAHRLRGAVTNFTMGPAAADAQALERMGSTGQLGDAAAGLTALERSMTALQLKVHGYAIMVVA
jgi:two-component system sensor histidine kinase/response regulator